VRVLVGKLLFNIMILVASLLNDFYIWEEIRWCCMLLVVHNMMKLKMCVCVLVVFLSKICCIWDFWEVKKV